MKKDYEIIKFEDGNFSLDVSISPYEETVWLTQEQISLLFGKAKSTINEHINNIFNGELDEEEVSRKFGKSELSIVKTKPLTFYNLDLILAVGYRVNSKRGIIFRRWVTNVLKNYLLKGAAIDEKRCLSCVSNILNLQDKYNSLEKKFIDFKNEFLHDNYKLLYEGEILEAYSFIIKLFFLATKRLIIIDNYADEFILNMLKNIKVSIIIYTNSYLNESNQENVKIIKTNVFHDRYIIVDDIVYSIGTSLNSIGKKRFTIHKLEDLNPDLLINKK